MVKTIVCPQCKNEISSKFEKCPYCGLRMREIVAIMEQEAHGKIFKEDEIEGLKKDRREKGFY